MKYCPVCRDEFMDHVDVCPDDHVSLVDVLEPERHEDEEKQVLLYDLSDAKLAEMVQGVLEDNEIYPVMRNDMFSSAMVVRGASAIGTQVKMFVMASEAERARELTEGMVKESEAE